MARQAARRNSLQERPQDEAAMAFDLVGRGMAQWRRERPDIDCSGKAVVGRILLLQDIVLRAANAALTQHSLRFPTYAVLATLRVSGAPYRMSPSQLQATMLLTSGGISNLLQRLERVGLVRRSEDKNDRRGVVVELTRSGIALADRAMVDYARVERSLCAMLDSSEQAEIAGLLSRMVLLSQASMTALPATKDEA